MTADHINSLVAIASSIFMRSYNRSKNFVDGTKLTLRDDHYRHRLSIDLTENLNIGDQGVLQTTVTLNSLNKTYDIVIEGKDGKNFEASLPADFSLSSTTLDFKINDQNFTVQLISMDYDGTFKIQFEGTIFTIRIVDDKANHYLKLIPLKPKIDARKIIKSPMPGVVKSIAVQVGDQVNEGQELCVIEAMKMQNSLIAESSGKVAKVNCKVGGTVEGDQILLQLE